MTTYQLLRVQDDPDKGWHITTVPNPELHRSTSFLTETTAPFTLGTDDLVAVASRASAHGFQLLRAHLQPTSWAPSSEEDHRAEELVSVALRNGDAREAQRLLEGSSLILASLEFVDLELHDVVRLQRGGTLDVPPARGADNPALARLEQLVSEEVD